MWKRAVLTTPTLHSPPSPKGLPIVGTLFEFLSAGGPSRLHEYIHKRHEELGPVFQERLGPVSPVFISDPADIKHVFTQEGKYPRHLLPEPWLVYNKKYGVKRGLLFMDGEEWFHFRRILNHQMLRQHVGSVFTVPCRSVALDLVKRWKSVGDGEISNLELEMYSWSLEVILAVLIGEEYNEKLKDIRPTIKNFASIIQKVFEETSKISLLPANIASSLHLPAWNRFVKVVDEVLETAHFVVMSIVPKCESNGGLLNALLDEKVESEDVVRIVTDLVLAAGDTTASTMQFILHLIASDPEIQQRLRDEAAKDERSASLLIKNILRETLRLYPVAPFITRYLPQDIILKECLVPAEQLITMSIYTSGINATYFPEPDKFWPDRWNRDTSGHYIGASNIYASLPFGLGARSCIGRKLVEIQIAQAIIQILNNFDLKLVNSTPVNMKLKMIGVPENPIRISVKKRQSKKYQNIIILKD